MRTVRFRMYNGRSSRQWLLLIALTVSNLVLALSPAVAQDYQAPDPRFGLVESFWLPEQARELGAGWERILFYWRELQPSGPDDWNTLHVREEWLAQANAAGRTVVGLLKNTAPWASVDGTEAGLPMGLDLPLNDSGNLWAGFVRKTVNYYSVRNVHHWIIWNEPEIRPGTFGFEFAGTIADYYRLLKVAYQVIKEVDPDATVHLAGLTWWHQPDYLERLLVLAEQDPDGPAHNYFFDVISLHIYFRTETVARIVTDVQDTLKRHAIDKPIWINETNAPPSSDLIWPIVRPQFPIDTQQQAWFVIQAFALGFASGAERVAVYKLIDIHLPPGGESFGLVRPDFSQRPAYFAYRTATRYFGHFTQVSHQQTSSFHAVAFQRQSGLTRVLWARGEAGRTVQVPALTNTAALVNALGRIEQVHAVDGVFELELGGARCSNECLVGGPPLLLVEATGPGALSRLPVLAYTNTMTTPATVVPTPTRVGGKPILPSLEAEPSPEPARPAAGAVPVPVQATRPTPTLQSTSSADQPPVITSAPSTPTSTAIKAAEAVQATAAPSALQSPTSPPLPTALGQTFSSSDAPSNGRQKAPEGPVLIALGATIAGVFGAAYLVVRLRSKA